MTEKQLMPERLGGYRLLNRLGEGGMGVVFRASDARDRIVALKLLRSTISGDPIARRRLVREVETMQRVRSPYVAEVLDADLTGETPYIVTRYVPGQTLDEVVTTTGPLSGTVLARLAFGLAEALAAVHAAGVVHRDLKPGNVMLLDGAPVVIDFGIAQGPDSTRLTMTGMFMGTPGYLAPEVIEGQPSSEASDIHAWGATVAFAATGRPPYGSGPYETVFYRIVNGKVDVAGAPAPLLPLLTAALARDPAQRPTAVTLGGYAAALDAVSLVSGPAVTSSPAPEALRGAVPEALRGAVPEALGGAVPEALRGAVPEALRGAVPEALRGAVPEALGGAAPGGDAPAGATLADAGIPSGVAGVPGLAVVPGTGAVPDGDIGTVGPGALAGGPLGGGPLGGGPLGGEAATARAAPGLPGLAVPTAAASDNYIPGLDSPPLPLRGGPGASPLGGTALGGTALGGTALDGSGLDGSGLGGSALGGSGLGGSGLGGMGLGGAGFGPGTRPMAVGHGAADVAEVLPPVRYVNDDTMASGYRRPPGMSTGASSGPDFGGSGILATGRWDVVLGVATMVLVASVSVLLPVAGTLAALAVITILRASGVSGRRAARLRASRGASPGGVVRAVVTFPWYVVRALGALVMLCPFALAAAAVAAGLTVALVPGDWPLRAIAYAAGAAVAFYGLGPGSSPSRWQLSRMYDAISGSRTAQGLALAGIGVVSVAAFTAAITWPSDYWPMHTAGWFLHFGGINLGPLHNLGQLQHLNVAHRISVISDLLRKHLGL